MYFNRQAFLGQVRFAGLGQADPCIEYKNAMDAYARKISYFRQQAQEAKAKGDTAGFNSATSIALAAARSWEWQRYLYEKCKRSGYIRSHERVEPKPGERIPTLPPVTTPTSTPVPTPTPPTTPTGFTPRRFQVDESGVIPFRPSVPTVPQPQPAPTVPVRPGVTSFDWSQRAVPISTQATAAAGEPCPPGQFRAYPGGPCRGSVAPGGLPSIPGGLTPTSSVMAPTSAVPYTSMGRRAFMGQVPIRGWRPASHRQLGQQTVGPILRFIVTDEAGGRFIPGAVVSLLFEDGTRIMSKLADNGGNVSFTKREILEEAAKVGLEGARGVIWYTVEAPGYALQDSIVWDPSKPADEQLNKIYTVALKEAAVSSDVAPYIAGVALITALGLVLHFSK